MPPQSGDPFIDIHFLSGVVEKQFNGPNDTRRIVYHYREDNGLLSRTEIYPNATAKTPSWWSDITCDPFGQVMFEILISPDWAHWRRSWVAPCIGGKPGPKRRE